MDQLNRLLALDVGDFTEKKNGLTYLTWSVAWREFIKVYPQATYKILKDEQGNAYFGNDKIGYMVYTEVTANELTHQMWLPVMDYKNKSMMSPTTFDVNKALMRCLTKNLAMFGLGIYIYAGEDLPEGGEEPHKQPPKKEYKAPKPKVSDAHRNEIKRLMDKLHLDNKGLSNMYKQQYNKNIADMTQADAEAFIAYLLEYEYILAEEQGKANI